MRNHKNVLSLVLTSLILTLVSLPALASMPCSDYLVGYWNFDQGQGTTAYDSVGSNNGTINGATWTTGIVGGALDFDGVNDYVTLSSTSVTTTSFTVSAWANQFGRGGGSSGQNIIFSQRDDTGGDDHCAILLFADTVSDLAKAIIRSSDGPSNSVSYSKMGNNEWHHYAMTVDSNNLIFYIDGIEVGQTPNTQAGDYTTSIDYIDIGRYRYNSTNYGFFNGAIDELAVYQTALSSDNIYKVYTYGLPRIATKPCPEHNRVCVNPGITFAWEPGFQANTHDVYLGTNFDDVNDASPTSGTYKGKFSNPTFDPDLAYDTTYYWRVDEVNDVNTWKGDIWAFKTYNKEPVGKWKFDEGIGTVTNDSAGTNNGTICGEGVNWTDGFIGNSLNFDGSHDYVLIPDNDRLDLTTEGTIAVWIYPRDMGQELWGRIIAKDDPGSSGGGGFSLYLNDGSSFVSKALTLRLTDNITNSNYNTDNDVIELYEWQHFIVTWDEKNIKFYKNGQIVTTLPTNHRPSAGTSDLYVGNRQDCSRDFDGKIDEVVIFNRALSELQVEKLYLASCPEKATYPCPVDGETYIGPNVVLGWKAGPYTADVNGHDVYFGTDFNDVKDGVNGTRFGLQSETSFDPSVVGRLEYNTTYYWRIDEVNDVKVWKGDVWSFTTGIGLVGFWKFDEGAGDGAYDSACSNHGVINGATWANGTIGNALDFDGIDDYVKIPSSKSLSPTDELTICFWIYNRGGQDAGVFKFGSCPDNSSSPYNSFYMTVEDDTGKVRLQIVSSPGTYDYVYSNSLVAQNQWHHVAGTFNRGEAKIYIDGQLDRSATLSVLSIKIGDQPLTIGGYWSYCSGKQFMSRLNGLIDEVAVYDSSLSEEEIRFLYLKNKSTKSYDEYPIDDAKHIFPKVILRWAHGASSAEVNGHDVYFGTDYNDVNNGINGTSFGLQSETNFDPGGLEYDTTYYWRVDEVNNTNVWRGDVWCFTTVEKLVSHWGFDEGSGNKIYDLAGNNNGIIHNATWTDGVGGGSLIFDGYDSYVQIPDHDSLDLTQEGTIAVFVKPDNWGVNDRGRIIDKSEKDSSLRRYILYLNDRDDGVSKTFSLALSDSSGTSIYHAKNDELKTYKWSHIAVTWDADNVKFYKNGEIINTLPTVRRPVAGNGDLCIGKHFGDFKQFEGKMDNLLLYSSALSENEISQLYSKSPHKVINPEPFDATTDVNPNNTLNWTPNILAVNGFNIYFGTNFDDVNEGVNGTFQGFQSDTEFDPGLLECSTTYYWRVDGVESTYVWKGDTWSFATLPDLVGYWKFDEGSGNIAKDFARNNDGNIEGAKWAKGVVGGALDFDGDGDYVEIPSSDSLSPTSQLTIGYWLYNRGGQDAGIFKCVGCPDNSSSPYNSYYMAVEDDTGKVRFQIISSPGVSDYLYSNSSVAKNEWHHIVGTFDKGKAKIYIDGQLDCSTTLSVSSIKAGDHPLTIGRYYSYCSGSSPFANKLNGLIDEVAIYHTAISLNEINRLYIYGLPRKATLPIPEHDSLAVNPQTVFTWEPGFEAKTHDVFLGTNFDDVNDADHTSNTYRGRFSTPNFDPDLACDTTYYWRVDEVNDVNTWKGDIWSFTTRKQPGAIYVDQAGTQDTTSIQTAIDSANQGDTIIVAPGTYFENISFNGKAITLTSTDPLDPNIVEDTIVDAQGSPIAVSFTNNETPDSIINGFSITGTASEVPYEPDGGILTISSHPTIQNCIIYNNDTGICNGYDEYGDISASNSSIINCKFHDNQCGIYNDTNSCPTITSCTFNQNNCGISNEYGSPTILNCIFTNNSSFGGSAINNLNGSAVITDCLFSGNSAMDGGPMYSGYGGAVLNTGNLRIYNTTFLNNFADKGGAIYNGYRQYGGSLHIEDCNFIDNYAQFQGGAVHIPQGSSALLITSNFTGNYLTEKSPYYKEGNGGAVSTNSKLTVNDCNFNQNFAIYGGAIGRNPSESGLGVINIKRSTFLDNDANYGGAICSATEVNDCNFIGNFADNGGAIYQTEIIRACSLSSNVAEKGGAAYNCLEVLDCCFEDNYASNDGGAVILANNINNCLFINNSAGNDGGAFSKPSPPPLTYPALNIADCIFENNSAQNDGGAISIKGSQMLFSNEILNCKFINNSAGNNGGGAYATFFVKNCIFQENSAINRGGGLCENPDLLSSGSNPINCLFTGNSAYQGGGLSTVRLYPTNCTIINNSATYGSGIYVEQYGRLYFKNSIVWNNDANQIDSFNPDQIFSAYFSCIQGGWSGNGMSNISDDPLFIDPSNGNFRLSHDSPCIDFCRKDSRAFPVDLDGFPRQIDDLCTPDDGNNVDIGAYEYLAADIQHDGDVDYFDYAILAANWWLQSSAPYLNTDLNCDAFTDPQDLSLLSEFFLSGKE